MRQKSENFQFLSFLTILLSKKTILPSYSFLAIICLIISWFTLECRFAPTSWELHEVTLLKLVYLYDPEACGRAHFYNVTMKHHNEYHSTIMWPVRNALAASFRR